MRDELYDRDYQAGRAKFNAGIDRALASLSGFLSKSSQALHRVQWAAPWDRPTAGR